MRIRVNPVYPARSMKLLSSYIRPTCGKRIGMIVNQNTLYIQLVFEGKTLPYGRYSISVTLGDDCLYLHLPAQEARGVSYQQALQAVRDWQQEHTIPNSDIWRTLRALEGFLQCSTTETYRPA